MFKLLVEHKKWIKMYVGFLVLILSCAIHACVVPPAGELQLPEENHKKSFTNNETNTTSSKVVVATRQDAGNEETPEEPTVVVTDTEEPTVVVTDTEEPTVVVTDSPVAEENVTSPKPIGNDSDEDYDFSFELESEEEPTSEEQALSQLQNLYEQLTSILSSLFGSPGGSILVRDETVVEQCANIRKEKPSIRSDILNPICALSNLTNEKERLPKIKQHIKNLLQRRRVIRKQIERIKGDELYTKDILRSISHKN